MNRIIHGWSGSNNRNLRMPKAKEQRSVNLIPLRQTQNDYQILASQNTRAISGLASSSQKHERRLERTTETLAKVSYPLLPYLHCVQNLAIPSNGRSTPPIYASCPYDQASLDQQNHSSSVNLSSFQLLDFNLSAWFPWPWLRAEGSVFSRPSSWPPCLRRRLRQWPTRRGLMPGTTA